MALSDASLRLFPMEARMFATASIGSTLKISTCQVESLFITRLRSLFGALYSGARALERIHNMTEPIVRVALKGKQIARLLARGNISPECFSVSELGTSAAYFRSFLRGERTPSPRMRGRILLAARKIGGKGVSFDELFRILPGRKKPANQRHHSVE